MTTLQTEFMERLTKIARELLAVTVNTALRGATLFNQSAIALLWKSYTCCRKIKPSTII